MNTVLKLPSASELSRRRYQRIRMPVPVAVGTHLYHTVDWSVGGFRLAISDPGAEPLAAALSIPAGDAYFTFLVAVERIHHNVEERFAGFRFIDMTEAQHDMLRALVVYCVTGGAFPLSQITDDPDNLDALREVEADGIAKHPGYLIQRI